MSKKIELIGQKFGRWVVIGEAPSAGDGAQWLCRCSCAAMTEAIVNGKRLRRGYSKSCGCYGREADSERYCKGDGPVFRARKKAGLSQIEYADLVKCCVGTIMRAERRNSTPRNHRIKSAIHKLRPPEPIPFLNIQANPCGYCNKMIIKDNRTARKGIKRSKSGRLFCNNSCGTLYRCHGPVKTDTALSPETVAKFQPNARDTSKVDKWTGAEKAGVIRKQGRAELERVNQ